MKYQSDTTPTGRIRAMAKGFITAPCTFTKDEIKDYIQTVEKWHHADDWTSFAQVRSVVGMIVDSEYRKYVCIISEHNTDIYSLISLKNGRRIKTGRAYDINLTLKHHNFILFSGQLVIMDTTK